MFFIVGSCLTHCRMFSSILGSTCWVTVYCKWTPNRGRKERRSSLTCSLLTDDAHYVIHNTFFSSCQEKSQVLIDYRNLVFVFVSNYENYGLGRFSFFPIYSLGIVSSVSLWSITALLISYCYQNQWQCDFLLLSNLFILFGFPNNFYFL